MSARQVRGSQSRQCRPVAAAGLLACVVNASASAQPQPTPGAPSSPLSPAAVAAGVQDRITYQHGIEFVTIGDVGNQPWRNTSGGYSRVDGRGSVGYEYRIARFEVTTAQWAEFLSAAAARPTSDRIPFISSPSSWGGTIDPTYTGVGRRYIAQPGREMTPVGNISWRTAAIYCNWLHNNRSTDRSAFLSGAYDVSTFGYYNASSIFSDQLTRSPGARFFIPTLDEWIKAAHYDPNRTGTGQGGWWTYSITSDTAPVYAPPGVLVNGQPGQSSSFSSGSNVFPGYSPYSIPLNAYPTVQSPWGLFNTAGGVAEWSEEPIFANEDPALPFSRSLDGSAWGYGARQAGLSDRIDLLAGDYPSIDTLDYGFRVAASAPSSPCSPADIVGGAAGPGPDGTLDGNDFIAFINSFAIGEAAIDPAADLDRDGTIDGSDFVNFINAFALGC
jgi:sulfatase modifying factor 1